MENDFAVIRAREKENRQGEEKKGEEGSQEKFSKETHTLYAGM